MSTVRPAEPEDMAACVALTATYTTRVAWQLTLDGDAGRDGPLNAQLQQVRLPRTLTLALPSAAASLDTAWNAAAAVLVACEGPQVCGYLVLETLDDQRQAVLGRLLVDLPARGKGMGSALVRAARMWGAENGLVRLLAHAPLRNAGGVTFYQRRGFRICGHSEHFYATREDALLLERWL
ncbi:MAG: GNAT family N-acetyltransferase [Chloroflexales bacterium]|nr:GNAT family N-acetyltransferase [Chloroflexales bacterium]